MMRKPKNDFRSFKGDFIYRHHVEPRVKLYVPREESCPIPMKYIDFTRTTGCIVGEKIDGYWNVGIDWFETM